MRSLATINDNTNDRNNRKDKINIRFLESELQTRISILIVDRKLCLAAELKDYTKETSLQAIGLSSYSNSNELYFLSFLYLKLFGNKQKCMNS